MTATITPNSIDPTTIPAQRAAHWRDFHPETYCHRCGTRNIVWFTDRELWDFAGGDNYGGGILCPQCFVELFEERMGDGSVIWELRRWQPSTKEQP